METAEPTDNKTRFKAALDPATGRVAVALRPDFTIDDWPGIEKYSREQMAQGKIQWTIDLTELRLLSSRMMGQCIGLNAVLGIRGGSLELRVKHESAVALALTKARIQRIMTVVEI